MNKHPLADCESCPLKDEMYVPSAFGDPSHTRLAVVGEAPGFHETVRKAPFMGPSGQLLNMALQQNGYKREEVFLTNVVSCRPPDNATPPKAAIAACRERLNLELARSGAKDIVAVGGTAVEVCSDSSDSITRQRVGPPKAPSRRLQSLGYERLVATWHPAYCLRNGDAYPTFVEDIGKLNRKNGKWEEPDWAYYDEGPLAAQALDDLSYWQDTTGRYELVVDIEVGIEKDTAFDHPNHYQMLCIGLCYDKGKALVIGEEALKEPGVRLRMYDLLKRSKLIGHNGKFDLAGLYPLFPKLELWFDTMLAHYVLDERPGTHGLKIRAIEQLGAPAYDDAIKQYVPRGGNYANIPREILYRYNAFDVACTWDLYELYVEELAESVDIHSWPYPDLPVRNGRDVHDFLVAASNQLMYLELNGIAIDRKYSDELDTIYLNRLYDIEVQLSAIVQVALTRIVPDLRLTGNFNPRSPKQIKDFLATQGLNVESTNVETLQMLLKTRREGTPLHEFLTVLLKHRRDAKLHGTFVKGIRKRLYRGRVYTTYMLHGTTSGRLASRNPNLQNIVRDKEIRKQFSVSKPENVLIQADYKQAEGRIICWLAQDEYLRSIFSDPEADLFTTLGRQLYRKDVLNKEERVRVKAYFYGLSFGREAFSIAREFERPTSEVERELRGFFELIPNVAQWQNDIREQVLNGKDLVSPFGRRRRFPVVTKQNKKDVLNEALSYLPQTTASDVCLSSLIELRPRLRGKAFIRLTIHDALVTECHEKDTEEVAAIMQEVMVDQGRRLQTYVPFAVDVSVGKSWGEL